MLDQARQHIAAEEFDRVESLCADVLVLDLVNHNRVQSLGEEAQYRAFLVR